MSWIICFVNTENGRIACFCRVDHRAELEEIKSHHIVSQDVPKLAKQQKKPHP